MGMCGEVVFLRGRPFCPLQSQFLHLNSADLDDLRASSSFKSSGLSLLKSDVSNIYKMLCIYVICLEFEGKGVI